MREVRNSEKVEDIEAGVHPPSGGGGQIVFSNCLDLYLTSPDSGERQNQLRKKVI